MLKICRFLILKFLLVLQLRHSRLVLKSTAWSKAPDYELQRCSGNDHRDALINATILQGAGKGKNDGFLAVIDNAFSSFRIKGFCEGVQTTSMTAKAAHCRYAVNGGPFNSFLKGGCVGPVVSDSRVLSGDWNTSYAAFGLTASGHWIVGKVSQETAIKFNVTQLVTGLGSWLVRNAVPQSQVDHELAGRTAIGIDRSGRLMLLQVDGCERCKMSHGPSGLTLTDLSQLLVRLGALHAINLDGGGSSVTVVDGKVVDHPRGLNIDLKIERPVTSVVCIT